MKLTIFVLIIQGWKWYLRNFSRCVVFCLIFFLFFNSFTLYRIPYLLNMVHIFLPRQIHPPPTRRISSVCLFTCCVSFIISVVVTYLLGSCFTLWRHLWGRVNIRHGGGGVYESLGSHTGFLEVILVYVWPNSFCEGYLVDRSGVTFESSFQCTTNHIFNPEIGSVRILFRCEHLK